VFLRCGRSTVPPPPAPPRTRQAVERSCLLRPHSLPASAGGVVGPAICALVKSVASCIISCVAYILHRRLCVLLRLRKIKQTHTHTHIHTSTSTQTHTQTQTHTNTHRATRSLVTLAPILTFLTHARTLASTQDRTSARTAACAHLEQRRQLSQLRARQLWLLLSLACHPGLDPDEPSTLHRGASSRTSNSGTRVCTCVRRTCFAYTV
jgi:hypothetical protein